VKSRYYHRYTLNNAKRCPMNGKFMIACCAVVVVVAAAWVHHEWREEKRSATFSCLSSISQTLSQYDAEHPISEINAASEWRSLDDSESLSKMRKIWEQCDCSKSRWWKSQPGFDAWGHLLHIAVRMSPNQRREYLVSSSGPDGISGSSDDIQSPSP
jgi:hypothetical protein